MYRPRYKGPTKAELCENVCLPRQLRFRKKCILHAVRGIDGLRVSDKQPRVSSTTQAGSWQARSDANETEIRMGVCGPVLLGFREPGRSPKVRRFGRQPGTPGPQVSCLSWRQRRPLPFPETEPALLGSEPASWCRKTGKVPNPSTNFGGVISTVLVIVDPNVALEVPRTQQSAGGSRKIRAAN